MNTLTDKEKKTIIGTFELAYGYSGRELVKIEPFIAEIFRKLDIDVEKAGEKDSNS